MSGFQVIKVQNVPLRNAKSPQKQVDLLETILGAGSWTYELSSREVTWSKGLFRLLGLDPMVVKANFDLFVSMVHPDDQVTHEQMLGMADSNEMEVTRFRLIRPDGHLIWLESVNDLQFNRFGELAIMHGVIQDITKQEKLRSDLARIRSINTSLHQLSAGTFWRADAAGEPLDLAGWKVLTGQNATTGREGAALAMIHPDDRELYRAKWRTGIALNQRIEFSVRILGADGKYAVFHTAAVPVLDGSGKLLEWHGITAPIEARSAPDAPLPPLQKAHIRAARALLGLSAKELADATDLSFSTIRRIEEDTHAVRQESMDQVRAALESRGVCFTPDNQGGIMVGLNEGQVRDKRK